MQQRQQMEESSWKYRDNCSSSIDP